MQGEERTWYVDGPYTHGMEGFASVTDEATTNFYGAGADYEVQATIDEIVAWLVAHEFVELETDVDELAQAWAVAHTEEN